MRIAQVVNSLEVGGLERLAVDLAVAQKTGGHEPHIFCVARRGALADEAEREGIPVTVLGKETGFSPRIVWRLSHELRKRKIDLVHTHNALTHHYGVLASGLAGVRVVVNTQHGVGGLQVDRKLDRIYRTTLPWTDSVVVVSEETRKYFVSSRGVPADKSRTIVNGIPLAKFQCHRAWPGQRYPRVVFGTVGRLAPAKDHATLIDAFAKVRTAIPCAEMHIAGDGPLRPDLERQIEHLGLNHCVYLRGQILDVARFLETLDVFVLSSVTEALPLVVLEAMAAGLPIVSTRVGGIPEVAPAGTVAIYCSCSDPQELTRALISVSNPIQLSSMSAAAFNYASHTVGLDRTWSQYEHLFSELLAHTSVKRTR